MNLRCLLLLLLTWPAFVRAQQITNVNATISIINGEPFYIHQVLEGQTIEAIAAAYYVEEKAIGQANTGIIAGIKPGIELKIPYTDASSEALSRQSSQVRPSQEKIIKRTESQEPKPVVTKPAPKPTQVTPLQEAVTLLDEEKPAPEPLEEVVVQEELPEEAAEPEAAAMEPVAEPEFVEAQASEPKEPEPTVTDPDTAEQPELIMDLDQLSREISESLQSLQEIKKVLETPEGEEAGSVEPEPVDMATARFVNPFLDSYMHQFFDTAKVDSIFHLREYFFATVDRYGRITALEDERTVTNENTSYLNMDAMEGLVLDAYEIPEDNASEQVALGIEIDVQRYTYKLKVKRKKVRVYESALYVQYLPKDHPHTHAILEKAREMGERGKCQVVLLDGVKRVSTFKRFEYNPFGERAHTLIAHPVMRIEQMNFK